MGVELKMKKLLSLLAVILLIFITINLSVMSADTAFYVFSAASLTDAMTEIANEFENKYPEIDLKLNFASSGTLQKQIEQGAPADYFISAGIKQMDNLENKDLINSRTDLLKNRMVVVGVSEMESEIKKISDLKKSVVKYIAMGMPESVPAGKYAKETLEFFGLWAEIQNKIVQTKDVRQALTYIDTGNSDLSFVYASDATVLEKGKILLEVPEKAHSPIIYPAAAINRSDNTEAVKLFSDFLQSKISKGIFSKYGFIIN